MLHLDALNKEFGTVKAVNSVTLKFPEGQVVGIIGNPGAGKSTLLRLVNRLMVFSSQSGTDDKIGDGSPGFISF